MKVIKYLKDLISDFIKSLFNHKKDITRDGDENDIQDYEGRQVKRVGKPHRQPSTVYNGRDPGDDDEEGDNEEDIDDYYYNDQTSQGIEY